MQQIHGYSCIKPGFDTAFSCHYLQLMHLALQRLAKHYTFA